MFALARKLLFFALVALLGSPLGAFEIDSAKSERSTSEFTSAHQANDGPGGVPSDVDFPADTNSFEAEQDPEEDALPHAWRALPTPAQCDTTRLLAPVDGHRPGVAVGLERPPRA